MPTFWKSWKSLIKILFVRSKVYQKVDLFLFDLILKKGRLNIPSLLQASVVAFIEISMLLRPLFVRSKVYQKVDLFLFDLILKKGRLNIPSLLQASVVAFIEISMLLRPADCCWIWHISPLFHIIFSHIPFTQKSVSNNFAISYFLFKLL